jgi:hypothetical protein
MSAFWLLASPVLPIRSLDQDVPEPAPAALKPVAPEPTAA